MRDPAYEDEQTRRQKIEVLKAIADNGGMKEYAEMVLTTRMVPEMCEALIDSPRRGTVGARTADRS